MSRPTQDTAKLGNRFVYGTVTLYGPLSSGFHFNYFLLYRSPTTPVMPKHYRFRLLRGRSPLLAQSLLFSFPAGTKMFQFPAFAHCLQCDVAFQHRVSPFGHSGIKGYLHLLRTYRSLSRPSSPPRAKASTVCPSLTFSLFFFTRIQFWMTESSVITVVLNDANDLNDLNVFKDLNDLSSSSSTCFVELIYL